MNQDKKITLIIVIGIFIVIGGVATLSSWISSGGKQSPNIEIPQKSYIFGKVRSEQDVKYEFNIKNIGQSPLKLKDFTTSCACTTFKVLIGSSISPEFGMHIQSNWQGEIAPGESGKIQMIFDANYHKNTKGPVIRTASFTTNDPSSPKVELKLEGEVID